MYEPHFGLREKPFSLNPDPAFLYLGRKHAMALTMLEYGIANGAGIIVISGEIGAGKTTLIRHLLGKIDATSTVGLISNTHRSFGSLIQWVTMAFGLEHEGVDKVTLYSRFVDFLIREYAAGKRTVLIVDEAQNMDGETLEELRVISNINADKHLVLQVILVGQPELRRTLRQPHLEQFAQRISVDYHLETLSESETSEYIDHRLQVAGGAPGLIEEGAKRQIFELSAGVPRLINSLCDQAMLYAFADGRTTVSADAVSELLADKRKHGLFGAGKIDYGT